MVEAVRLTRRQGLALLATAPLRPRGLAAQTRPAMQAWPLNTPARTRIHDVAPAPDGGVWFTAQRSGHLGWFDPKTGKTELKSGESSIVEPPTKNQGARRVWSDSRGRIWVSEWNSGNQSMRDPRANGAATWRTWRLPGDKPRTYAVWVDDKDMVWASDFGASALLRFDPER